MKKKWEKFSVEIQVVHVVVEVDSDQKYNRYAMSKMYANEGMEKTTTCYSKQFLSADDDPLTSMQ